MQPVIFCSLIALAACLPKPQPPVMAKLPVTALKVNGDAEMASEGLKVSVTPIYVNNVQKFPQVWRTVTVQSAPTQPGATPATSTTQVAILPLPAFQVRIVNETGHVVRLSSALFRLESNTGQKWSTYASAAELVAWLQLYQTNNGNDPMLTAAIVQEGTAATSSMQFLNRTVELLKGDEWTGYLVFNLGYTKLAELTQLMDATQRFTLRLAELPVATNEAGQVTKTTEFKVAIDKGAEEVDVTCPAGTTQPAWNAGCERQW